MSTPYSELVNLFLRLVEKDIDFFNYFNLDEADSMALATERSMGYMEEAVSRIMLECRPSVDFFDKDDEAKEFSFTLTPKERMIISSLMYESYLHRDISYLKTQSVNYTPTELRVFSPSEARSSFMDMYKVVCERNKYYLEEYRNQDRNTGEFIGVDYTSQNIDD